MLSLLDRLIDDNPESRVEPVPTDAELRRQVRESIQQNVSILLNTRSWLGTWPRELDHIRRSIINFGLPDTSGIAIDDSDVRSVLGQTIRMALEIFEPRLTRINVSVFTAAGARSARVLIEAQVRGDLEPMVMGTVLGRSRVVDLTKARS